MLCDPFLMKKFMKSEVCGSREQCTRPTNWWKVVEKSEIYGYCSWTVAICPPKTCAAEEKKKKKKTQEMPDVVNATYIQTNT